MASIVKIVRKYKDYSIADIKSKVENDNYIFTCNAIDEAECKKMLKCIKELNKAKISTQLYEYDEAIDLQLLKNWLGYNIVNLKTKRMLEIVNIDLKNQQASMMIMHGCKVVDEI